jgi:transposase-like protein
MLFLSEPHTRVYEQLLEAEMDHHLGYEKNSVEGNNTGNSHNGEVQQENPELAREFLISMSHMTE